MLLRNALTTMPRLDEDEDDVENENYSVSGNLMSTWEAGPHHHPHIKYNNHHQ